MTDLQTKAVALLEVLHAEMEEGNGVHPFDVYDRLGVIIAMLKGEYDPDEEG